MRIVPQRKVKSSLRVLLLMTGIFFLTILVCVGFSLYFLLSGFRIISPLTTLGLSLDSQQMTAKVEASCSKEKLSCQNIIIMPDGSIELTINDVTIVFLSPRKDIGKQLASLQQVASQLTIKGKTLKRIDFRFDNIVVSF